MITSDLLANGSYFDGQFSAGEVPFEVLNPASGQPVYQVSRISSEQIEHAIQSAHAAFGEWSSRTADERAKYLRHWHDLILEHEAELAEIMTLEQGKPLKEAAGEIRYAASFVDWFAEEARRIYGDVIPGNAVDKRIITLKQPVGVVAAITPWNFPSSMITRKAAPALAAGCTFLVKPSEQTPLSALALATLAHKAGVPKGVFNVLVSNQSADIGKIFTSHEKIAKFSFTGSTEVGKKLNEQCAQGIKRVSLELGGNAPFIVFDDADIDKAVDGLIASKFRNAGQTCVCANRILVQNSIREEFTERFREKVAQLKVGDGMKEGTDIGPLIQSEALERVQEKVNQSISEGAKLVSGGKRLNEDSNIYLPTILSEVRPDMVIASEETFGPVAPIIGFDTEEEGIQLANDTEYGLAAYFYSQNLARVWRVAEALEYGMVGVNEGMISNSASPFGGVKYSGIGREGSKYGIDEFIEVKAVTMGGIC